MDDTEYAFQYTRGSSFGGLDDFEDFDALDEVAHQGTTGAGAGHGQSVQLGATASSSPDGKQNKGSPTKSYTERATTRTQCRKLAKFIRLMQAQFEAAVAAAAQTTSQQFLKVLKNRDR